MFSLPSDVAGHLAGGGTLVVPSRQRARAVQLTHAAAQTAQGKRVWVSADVLAVGALGWELRSWAVMGAYPRLYYGTDMRAYQLLTGCALACLWRTGALDRVCASRMAA